MHITLPTAVHVEQEISDVGHAEQSMQESRRTATILSEVHPFSQTHMTQRSEDVIKFSNKIRQVRYAGEEPLTHADPTTDQQYLSLSSHRAMSQHCCVRTLLRQFPIVCCNPIEPFTASIRCSSFLLNAFIASRRQVPQARRALGPLDMS